jgi:triacylglycerol esterase/lipase EstA (alpha/beta hydrolase family)
MSLTTHDAVASPAAVVLVLHGGKHRSRQTVTGRSLSWQRAAALGRTLGRRLRDDRVAVRLLRYRTVGWNGGAGPIADARWALDEIAAEATDVPVVLVGHSMGGRTACQVAELHAAHGRRDRITRATDTRAYVMRADEVAAATSYTDMGDRGHYLLTGIHAWNAFTVDRVSRVLG